MIPATGIHFRKVRLAFCRFSCQRTERCQIHCSKHTSPVGRPHGKFYSSAIDVHSPMRAGEWNFTPLKDNPTGHSERKKKKRQTEKRGGKTISKSGQEWTLPAQLGQLKTGQDGKGLLQIHLWCPNDLPRLWDRIE